MDENFDATFIFKTQEIQITLQSKDFEDLPKQVLLSLLKKHQYEIQSNISKETFQSIIKYFASGNIPDIQVENIDEIDMISKELNIQSILNVIQQKRELFDNILKYINLLSDKSSADKSVAEHKISQSLDYILLYYGNKLMNSQIQSLYNIFSYEDRNFTSHERLYDLIQSHFEKNHNPEIFILF